MISNEAGSHTSDKDIADALNSFFVNVGCSLPDNVISNRSNFNSKLPWNNFSFFIVPTDQTEILNVIHHLKNSNSAGFDGISNLTLKKIAPKIVHVLEFLFNRSFIEGQFPQCLKWAIVLPIHKKGDRSSATNYRPISILSVFSKILEKLMKSRMLIFISKHKLLSDTQFGFREGLNTELALLSAMDKIANAVNCNKKVGALFLDISKAFDMVDYDILLEQLWRCGFRGSSYEWFTSYLHDRCMSVKVNGCLSDKRNFVCGVPQGSVLGPLLFLVFFESLLRVDFKGKCVAFADDLAIVYECENRVTVECEMNADLIKVRYWFDSNKLLLSDKSKCMFFDLIKPIERSNIKYHDPACQIDDDCINCLTIEQVDSFKYLGVFIDRKLTFNTHVDFVVASLQKSIRSFYLIRDVCPALILKNLYYALVYSKLNYGLSIWGGAYATTLDPLIKLQKYFVRVMSSVSLRTHSHPLFQNLEILPLRYLYVFKVLKIFFERSGHKNICRSIYPQRVERCVVPRPFKEFFRRYHIFIAPNIFNKLPISIKSIPNCSKFCSKLKGWLLNHSSVEFLFQAIGN